jgi:hypothetical protein
VGAFLKVFDDIQRRDEAGPAYVEKLPDMVMIDEAAFKERVAEQESIRLRIRRIRQLFDGNDQKTAAFPRNESS